MFHLKIIYNSRLYTFHEQQQEVHMPFGLEEGKYLHNIVIFIIIDFFCLLLFSDIMTWYFK